jgi:phosphoglycerate kinase
MSSGIWDDPMRLRDAEMERRIPSVRDLDVDGRRVFVRVDFNVPLKDGRVSDDTRVRASLPTLKMILERGGRPVIASHLGRPKGKPVPGMSLRPIASHLAALLGTTVHMAPDCVGDEVESLARGLVKGEALLLENLRFHPQEETNDDAFSRRLAALADLYVNDAFGSAHRAHASVVGITRHLPMAAAGLLMDAEIAALTRLRDRPEKPYAAVLGGAKVSDKIDLILNLIDKVETVLIGGAMAYTFMKARGIPIGASRSEDDRIGHANDILARAASAGVRLELPIDHVAARSSEPGQAWRTTDGPAIDDGFVGLDIGPKTREAYARAVAPARTIFWNGPLGLCEVPPYDEGTRAMARAIAGARAFSVVGGGDSIAAINRLGLAPSFSHLSTGGGASLEFLSGAELPGVGALAGAATRAASPPRTPPAAGRRPGARGEHRSR